MLVAASLVRPECNHGSAGTKKRKRGGDKKGEKKTVRKPACCYCMWASVGLGRSYDELLSVFAVLCLL